MSGSARLAIQAPGLVLAAMVAIAASLLEPWLRQRFGGSVPAMVLALVIGVLLDRKSVV